MSVVATPDPVYSRRQSLAFEVDFTLDGAPFSLDYTGSNLPYDDETKGKVILTVHNRSTNLVQVDSDDTEIKDLVMLMNGSSNSSAVRTVPFGIDTDGEYMATVWYIKKTGSTLTRRDIKTITFSVKTDPAAYLVT